MIDDVSKMINSIKFKFVVKVEENKFKEIDFKEYIKNDELGKKDIFFWRLVMLGNFDGMMKMEIVYSRLVDVVYEGFFINYFIELCIELVVVFG